MLSPPVRAYHLYLFVRLGNGHYQTRLLFLGIVRYLAALLQYVLNEAFLKSRYFLLTNVTLRYNIHIVNYQNGENDVKDSISLTVPMDYNALTRAGEMLLGLAADAAQPAPVEPPKPVAEIPPAPSVGASTTAVDDQHVTEPSAADVFTDPKPEPTTCAVETVTPVQAATEPAAPSAPPAGVEVDSDGLPWDERIHAGTKTTLAKTKQWKKKRGVAAELVTTVEAELRAAMAVPASGNVATTAVEPSEPAAPSTTVVDAVQPVSPPAPAAPAQPATPPPAPAATGGISTLPELMAASTGAGKTPADMLAAAQKCGLASVALLGARPDLIPTVAAELGLGG